MKSHHELHAEQIDYWNGAAGDHWADEQERIDSFLEPVLEVLIPRAHVKAHESVLDVGCGAGATTIVLANLVGPLGKAMGLDVSAPLLERARERSKGLDHTHYVLADAAKHPFSHPFADLLFSRFGVMFFGDPTAAFKNLKTALKPGGRVLFACWRKPDENPWAMVPLQAAYQHVARLPKPEPEDPGPFSFADPDRVTRILTGAGFAKPRFTPADVTLDVASGKGLDDAVHHAMGLGPASRALKDQPEDAVAKAKHSIREALAPYAKHGSVKLGGAIWLVEC